MGLLVRVFLALLAGYLLARLFRRSVPSSSGPAPRRGRHGLNPSEAVRASWSEVDEARKEEPGER